MTEQGARHELPMKRIAPSKSPKSSNCSFKVSFSHWCSLKLALASHFSLLIVAGHTKLTNCQPHAFSHLIFLFCMNMVYSICFVWFVLGLSVCNTVFENKCVISFLNSKVPTTKIPQLLSWVFWLVEETKNGEDSVFLLFCWSDLWLDERYASMSRVRSVVKLLTDAGEWVR